MLQALISLDDDQITRVLDAVRLWCAERRGRMDSLDGHRAVNAAVDLIQTFGNVAILVDALRARLMSTETRRRSPSPWASHAHRRGRFLLAEEMETALGD